MHNSALPADPVPVVAAGLTVAEVARRYRVGPDKVHHWIRTGELQALNVATAVCGRPRFVVTPEALAAFEKRRDARPAPKPAPRPRRGFRVDYFPD